MKSGFHNFFIGLLPSEIDWINDLKFEINSKYGCQKALNTEPHITLVPPFSMKVDEVEKMELNSLILTNSVELALTQIQRFKKRTLYLEIEESIDLTKLYKRANTLIKANWVEKRAFHPHITLANRDIPSDRFEELWNEFGLRPINRTIKFHSLCVFILDTKWKRFRTFKY